MAAANKQFFVYDRRKSNTPESVISVGPKDDYLDLRTRIVKHYGITSAEPFVICTTNREEINKATFEKLEGGETLYVLKNIDQELTGQTYQKVEYLPHYDTIIKSGMYEYYASEGQNPLPYAFAELIDNSLAATKNNVGSRKIELKLYLDDSSQQEKSTILVVDNGCGMTSWQLNNWAIYRLSKFNRKDKTLQSTDESGSKNTPAHKPRFLNSEISYFGAGGKQAIFFIGNSTRMITKPQGSKDVHELVISKDEFEQREKEKGLIYSGNILNRKPGDASHISPDEEGLREVIEDEADKDQFTCVVIWGISSEHVQFLKHNFSTWCSQLAHIYHYYLHGPNGNVPTDDSSGRAPSPYRHIDIEVSLIMKSGQHKVANLRNIDTDQETLLIRTASDRFDFRATVDGTRVVEGQLRYHPFLYDHESFPPEHPDQRGGVGTAHFDGEDEDELIANSAKPARGQRPIFECFWNGRLIPYTTIEEFDWCSPPKKARNIPLECFNRLSGVLWTDDAFQVSTNKLTFMDLENKLREKNTIFTRIMNGQAVRASIEKHFMDWLQACHEHSDKQIMFESFQESISRRDTQRYKQYPWAVFNAIEWDGKHFKKGQLIRTQRTNPIIIGSIRRFLLFGDYTDSVCATGGEVEIQQEPRSLYDEVKIFPLAKLDRKVTDAQLQKVIEEEEGRLPAKLYVTWPEGDQLHPNEKRPAGKAIGDIKVEIQNKKGENVSKLPGYQNKRLSVEMKIVWHAASGDKVVAQYVSPHNKNWGYWFRRMENINNLGAHTLTLQAMLSDSTTAMTSGKELPSFRIRFTVTEAAPDKFNVGYLEGPFRVGTPFQIPLDFLDKYGNSTKPSPDLEPELKANGLELSYEGVQAKGNSLIIKGIVAKGAVESNSGKSFTLTVKIPGLDENTQTLKIRLLPGPAHQLQVLPETPDQLAFENGASPSFDLAVLDMAGNYTCEPKFVVSCKFQAPRQSGLPTYTADLSNSGKGTITGAPLNLRHVQKEEKVVARFEVQNFKNIANVERVLTVLPSHQAASLYLSCTGEDGDEIELEHGRDLVWVAGEPITGLRFEVRDEIGKPITLTSNLVSKLKLNWTAEVPKDQVLAGRLPDINCPSSVKQTLFCHVSLNTGRVVDFAFTVKPKNGDPAILKVSCKGTTDVRIGEVHQSDILISLTDKFHNPIKKLHIKDLADLLIIAEGIDYGDVVKSLDQSCGFHVKGLKFMDSSLGCKEVCFQWRGLKDYLRLNMVPGPPASLAYINYNPAEPVTVTPDGKLPKPLMVQLQDARGNPSAEANIKVVLGTDEAIKSIPPQQPVKTDSKGKASFGILTLALKTPVPPKPCEFNICSTNCRGLFTLGTKATVGRSIINGPVLKLHLTCDPEKPVELNVEYKGKKTFTVADELPETTIHVLAEDGNVMCSVLGKQLSMKLVRIDCAPKNHQKVFTASPVETTSPNGYYHFRKVRVPEKSGEYNMQFHFNNGKHTLSSAIISLTVVPDSPVKLAPQQDPIIPSVSNQAKSSCRNLLKYLKLDLTDRFGNNTAMNITGVLTLQVVSPDPAVKEVPYFEGNVNQYQVPISKGCAVVQNLQIQENTEGVDGFQYILRFIPKLNNNKTVLPNYEVPFLFYNDASKQEEMAKLTKKRTELLKQLQTFEDLFQTTENIYIELEAVIRDAQTEESKFRGELRRLGFNSNFIKEEQHVAPALKICEQQKQIMDNKNRRTYLPAPYPEEPGVLGKIGHLAWVEEDDVSAVLSWHMRGDIDVVVTETMEKAKDIYRKTNGKQQVIALESIYKRNTSKGLPHLRNKSFDPTGNPKFALDYFIFRKDAETCRTVFANFIGDTIVLDTFDDATKYRTEVTKFCACPTLLAKTGERIASTGKFGGHQNRAPTLAQLQGNVFGEPPMKDLDRVQEQIQLLKKLSAAMKKQRDARTELDKQKQKDTTFVMKKKDYEQLKKEMAKVDEGIARLQNTGNEDERLPFPPVQDLVRNSPRRQSLPAMQASRYPPASPKTPNDSSVNGVSRRNRIPPPPATAPVERKRRRVT